MRRAFALSVVSDSRRLRGGQRRARARTTTGPQITKPPKLVKFVPAVYPKDKHDAHVTGSVLLSIEIGDDGKVGEVEVVKGAAPDFDAAAVAAVKQFVFEPAEIDHQPAPVKITYRYDFTIVEEIVKAGPQINFDGVVTERLTKRPMANVSVKITDLDGATAETDADGKFAFTDVPVGTHKIELSHPKLATVTTEETIAVGKRRTVKYLVEEKSDDEEGVDHRARAAHQEGGGRDAHPHRGGAARPRAPRATRSRWCRTSPAWRARRSARASSSSGARRPTRPRSTSTAWRSRRCTTCGGFRSTINSDLVRSINLSPGSYGADYGRGLGGLVRIDLGSAPQGGDARLRRRRRARRLGAHRHGHHAQLRLAIAGRVSYLDQLLPLVTSQDVGDFVPIPKYDDYQARATLALRQDEELALTFLASDDHLRRAIPSDDPTEVRSQNTDSGWKRVILRYTRLLPDGASVVVTPSFGFDTASNEELFGSTPVDVKRAPISTRCAPPIGAGSAASTTLSFGLDMQAQSSTLDRNGSLTLPAREGDIFVFGQPPRNDIASDHWNVLVIDTAPLRQRRDEPAGACRWSPGCASSRC